MVDRLIILVHHVFNLPLISILILFIRDYIGKQGLFRLVPSKSHPKIMPPDANTKNSTFMKTQGEGLNKNAMNGRQQNHHPYAPEEERPPSHFFSNSYEKASAAAMAGTGTGTAGTRMPSVLDMRHDHHNITGAGRNRQEELMHNVRRMRGGGHLPNAAAVALAQRRMIPPMAMGNGQRLPPNENENNDTTALRTESIDHIIAFQEAQALRNQELEQLRQLEFIRAVNQRRIEEEILLAEQQHQLRRRQLYHPPTHLAGGTSGSIIDEELMSRQARLSQLQFMPTDELHARVGPKSSGDESSMSRLQGGFQQGTGDRTVSSGGGTKSPHLAHHVFSESFAPVVDNFGQPRPRYYMPPSTLTSRSNSGGQTPAAAPLRFWNNGVEVDIRGTPLVSSASLNRLNSSNSATSTTATRTSATTSSSSPPDVNIVSQFSKLVMSCVPELNSSLSNLLSEVMQVRGFPSDPLIIHSKFPGFVGSALLELKSLGERSKDEEDLHERITNCVAAIEPYKSKNELGESSVHAQIRAIVEEGTERASGLILNDPSERCAKEKRKKKKKEMEMRIYGDGKVGNSTVSKKKKKRRRDSSPSQTIDILGMYMDHKYKVEEEDEADDLTASTKESSETSLPLSSDERTSNAKEVEKKDSSPSNTTTEPEPKEKGTSQPPVKKQRISAPSSSSDSSSSEHPQAESKSVVEQGPHSSLLRQIFGNDKRGGNSGNTTCSSTNFNAAADQKKTSDNTLNSGHLSAANVLLGLGR